MNRLIIAVIAMLFASCVKEEVSKPTFDIQENNLVVNAGDSLKFDFKGDANVITFYSGEFGSIYEYRERTQKELEGDITLSFATSIQNNRNIPYRELDILVSNNFNGKFSYADVTAANWGSLLDQGQYTLPTTGAEGALYTNAGKASVLEKFVPGKDTYFAIRYKVDGAAAAANSGRTWFVNSFSLLNEQTGGNTVIANQANLQGWHLLDGGTVTAGRGAAFFSTYVQFRSNNGATIANGMDIWLVSSPIDLFTTTPDRGVSIKNISQNKFESYTHVYTKPGTYKAVFVAANANIYGQKPVVKEVTVVVNPKI